ncbi:transmembrane protein, putative (macronuclear) [Tetrahymena thermophila SB210]|uniref:Autophagy-related protein 2 n=1 Tax=Tetrahymena thermophila (strain SB210) TaxID=312017 RepID=Q23F63_TETTS|nr:transmembrane protein, putative [Tetrahymena thermophila SB210]EAR95290.2 transmembrane protein, putative [Tetrahymena thermophila SB210]|eukprot:XP_001015535.2 transmembrane protein, putative [Tetrahymena thermophila SB210]
MNRIKDGIFSFIGGLAGILPSFNPIVETLVKNIVQKYLGQYVDIKQFQLKSIQDISLENVNLKIEEINSKILYKSPFIMTYGQIGKMKIQIPIQDLLTKQSKAEINQVEIHLRPNGKNISHNYFRKQENKEKSDTQKLQENEDYDPNKVNELKNILLKVALTSKVSVKDLVVKIFLQSTMSSNSSEEVYFMLRISEITSNEESKKNCLDNSQVKFDFMEQSQISMTMVGNPPNLNHNPSSVDSVPSFNLKVSNINLFILKDSSLNPQEFYNLQAKAHHQDDFKSNSSSSNVKQLQKEMKFPYQYPPHNHPTNILYVPNIFLDAVYNQRENDIQLTTELNSFEIMIEPYQLKVIWKIIEIIECWQKQIKCLQLLLITKDEKIKEIIIENNKNWTNEQESQIKNNEINQNNLIEESFVEDLLQKTVVEMEKSHQRDSKQLFNFQNSQQEKPSNQSFFNQSILVQNNQLPHFGLNRKQAELENSDFESSVIFNKSQLGKIIEVNVEQKSNANTISVKFLLSKCCIYVLKGSERKIDQNTSIEYSREWKYSKKRSLISQLQQNEQENLDNQNIFGNNTFNQVKKPVNMHIPCSYYMLKIANLEFNFQKDNYVKKFDADMRSFELMDVLLINHDPKQSHHRFQHFKFHHQKQQYQKQNSQIKDGLQDKISSTFWKSQQKDLEFQDERKTESNYLIKYQIDKQSHYCVNYIIYYNCKQNRQKKEKISKSEDLKIHSIINDFWNTEKKERKERCKNIQNAKKREEESLYEFNMRQFYPNSYNKLIGKSEDESSQNMLQKGSNNTSQHKFFTMTQKIRSIPMNQKSNLKEKQEEEIQSDELCANFFLDKLFINLDMKIMHDVALIQCPLSKYAHYHEKICQDLDQKIPKYEIPREIKKLLKSLNKNVLEFDIKLNLISCNLLTYGFKNFYISSSEVDNIYSNYAKWGCLCEVTDQQQICKKSNCFEELKNQRGSYKPHYLNITWVNPEILFVQKKDVNINFNEINIFSVNFQTEEFHKIIHIGRNFVLTQQNMENHFELTYPSILKYRVQREGQKEVLETLSQQIIETSEVEKKLDVQNLKKQQQQQSGGERQNEKEEKKSQKKSEIFHQNKGNKNQYDDRFYHDNEQNPDLNKVKVGLNIGIPILELYIQDEDLNTIGDIVFSLLTFMNLIDQFKYKSAIYKSFFENLQQKAILQSDNILIRIICSEVNIHYQKQDLQAEQNPLNQSKSQISQRFRLPKDYCLQQTLIFHMKDLGLEVLFNKEIKKEDDIKNFKLAMKISIGINTLMVIDNSLSNLISQSSNSNMDSLQNESNIIENFPKNIHLFRIQSVFLGIIKQENILIYKMNLSQQSQNSYQELYNLMASRQDDEFENDNSTKNNNQSNKSNLKAKKMILAIKILQQRINSLDNQLSLQMIFKKKQHEKPFREAKSKQQLDFRGLCLNQSVISLLPLSQSKLVLHFFESIQKFMLNDKINSDIMVKNEFKEYVFRDFILFRDVKIDIFPTPSCQLYSNFGQLLTNEVLEFISQNNNFNLSDRFMSNYRAVLSIEKLHIQKFQRREQRNCSKQIQINQKDYDNEEQFYEKVEEKIKQQNKVEKLLDVLDLKISKIQLDFLYQKDFNTSIDPFMIDFMFTNNSDQAIQSMGFSKIGIIFDLELNKLNTEILQLKVDGIQLGFFSDTLAKLPYFIDVLIFSLKYNQEQNKYILEAIDQAKAAIDQKDLEVQMAIYKTKIQNIYKNNNYHPFYPSDGIEVSSQLNKSVFQMNFQNEGRSNLLEQPVKEVEQENDENEEEQKKGYHKLEMSNSSQFEQFDESFEKIDGDEYVIDEKSLKENNRIIIDIQFVKIFLQEGLGFDFTSVNSNYNANKQMFLSNQIQASNKQQSQDQNIQQKIKDQMESDRNLISFKNKQEKDEEKSMNSIDADSNQNQIKQLNLQNQIKENEQEAQQQNQNQWLKERVINNYLEKQQTQTVSDQNILIVREKAGKKSAESLLFKIENIFFQIKSFEKNDQNIEKHVRVDINKIIAENGFQKYICLSTEKQKDSLLEQFLHLSFYIQIQEKTIVNNVLKADNRNANVDNQAQQKIKLINNTIKQIDLQMHQIIKISLSSQIAEMLKQFFKKQSQKEKKETKKILEDKFQKILNKHSMRQFSFNANYRNVQLIKDLMQENQQENFRIEKITSIDDLFIPEINIFISNKREGFDFSRLAKENGYFQIINIGEFHEIQVTLVQVTIYDKNIDAVGKVIIDQWMQEIKGNQKWQVASQLPLIKNIVNIGEGIFDLFYLPYSYYQQGMSVLDGTYQGVKKFVTNTTQESINLTSAVFSSLSSLIMKNAKGASSVISKAKNYFSESSDKNNQNNF